MANELPIFSVSDFLSSINQTLEYAYPSVEVEGEVTSFKVNQNKFVFFDLKDAGGTVGCFMTVWQLRLPIEDGMKVVVRATPKLTAWGKFSLTVQSIRPSGEGNLKKSYELLKAKLKQEGLFSNERKRPLPALPMHIGVISSTQAAGYADFIKILSERWGGIKVEVAHVQVQGEGAADQMIRAIRYFNEQERLPEVLVIIRGGGSADDLSTFNDELLVRAIATSRIPTLVGVGHEVDETLADQVADVRAATPSNAAQIIVPDKHAVIRQAYHHVKIAASKVEQVIDTTRADIRRRLKWATIRAEQSIDTIAGDVQRQMQRATRTILYQHERASHRLVSLQSQLGAYNPDAVLARGYALVRGALSVGEIIEVEQATIIATAEVQHVTKRSHN